MELAAPLGDPRLHRWTTALLSRLQQTHLEVLSVQLAVVVDFEGAHRITNVLKDHKRLAPLRVVIVRESVVIRECVI